MTPERDLCTYCAELEYTQLPDDVQNLAGQFVLDTLGIAIRAADKDSSRALTAGADDVLTGTPECTVWATGDRESATYAAFVNASFVHTLELDDTHREAVIHPGAPIVPTAFAIGEREGATGHDLLTAVVAGYEVACRLGMALNNHRVHLERGFHGTATCGVFGAAVAGGLLAGFDADELENLLGITLSQASGSLQYKANGAWTKRIHPGLAARDAVLAVALAKQGFRGAAEPITGRHGFLEMFGVDPDVERLTEGLGDDHEIQRTGIKPYACCRYNHPAIDATLEVVIEHDIDPEEITNIMLETFESAYELSQPVERKIRPENVVDAQFSPQYAVAVAAIDRQALASQYTRERLNDSELRSLLERVTVREAESMTEHFPSAWPARVSVETNRGTYTARVDGPSGEPEARLTETEMIEKFRSLTEPRTTATGQDAVVEAVLSLESRDIRDVASTIAGAIDSN
ncbi:MmgE/PrpD family protein [Natronosalvus caseinilyticus]|uniref:MmgE/PrpD family protein n=1 Tax=Natronosalvus caseinilyticus TaxID=2953747 RepID=UPI0028A78523|nr:MmgE/PrpD family protein [Natronosalvus caseinilyticus]